jgi:hypothetical protein
MMKKMSRRHASGWKRFGILKRRGELSINAPTLKRQCQYYAGLVDQTGHERPRNRSRFKQPDRTSVERLSNFDIYVKSFEIFYVKL